MSNVIQTQVAIIGGGPAGSSLAIFLRQRGVDCAIFEREQHPRFHVGESLLPENMVMLEKLGVMDKIRAKGFVRKPGATFIYDQPDEHGKVVKPATIWFKNSRFNSPPEAINVKRAEFDDLLLRHAVEKGASLYERWSVNNVVQADSGRVTGLKVSDPDGREFECRAEFVADCSGQVAWLARKLGVWADDPQGHAKAAFFTHYEGLLRDPAPADGNIVLAFAPGRWYWLIPVSETHTSVGVVCSKEVIAARFKGDPEAFFAEMMTDSPEVMRRLAPARKLLKVSTIQNYSYECRTYAGDGWVLVGDAAAFLDPIYSTGTSLAMRGAGYAAECLAKGLKNGDRSAKLFAPYERKIRQAQRFFKPYIYGWYEPAYQRVFREPRNVLGLMPSIVSMLAGDAYTPVKRFIISLWLPIFWMAVRYERRRIAAEQRRAAASAA